MSRILKGGAAAALVLATPLLAYYEGYFPQAYSDPVGIPTICYGHTEGVTLNERLDTQTCKALLTRDAMMALDAVNACIHVDLEPWEAGALVSFTYNVGGAALCSSTMAKLANAGAPAAQWCQQMTRWTHAVKFGVTIELPGLVKRRAAETKMCLGEVT